MIKYNEGLGLTSYIATVSGSTGMVYRSGCCISDWYEDDEGGERYTSIKILGLMPMYVFELEDAQHYIDALAEVFPKLKDASLPGLIAYGIPFHCATDSAETVHMYLHFLRLLWEGKGFLNTYARVTKLGAPLPLAIYLACEYVYEGNAYARNTCSLHRPITAWEEGLLHTYKQWGKPLSDEVPYMKREGSIRSTSTTKRKYGIQKVKLKMEETEGRFVQKRKDIRYSMGQKVTEAQIQRIIEWQQS